MQKSALRCGLKLFSNPASPVPCLPFQISSRRLSINSAISKGIRKSQRSRSRFDDAKVSPKKRAGDSYGRTRDRPLERRGQKGSADGPYAKPFEVKSGRTKAPLEYQKSMERPAKGSHDKKLSGRSERVNREGPREHPSSHLRGLRSRDADRRPEDRRSGPPRPSRKNAILDFGESHDSTSERHSPSFKTRTSETSDRGAGRRSTGRSFETPSRDKTKWKRQEGLWEGTEKRHDASAHRKTMDMRGPDQQSVEDNHEVLPLEPRQKRRESFSPRDGDDNRSERFPLDERPSKDPISIPYTTSASEFIYGASSVVAAMRARRRQFYKLYIHKAMNRENLVRDASIEKLAKSLSIPVKWLKDSGALPFLDKMSNSRPHNGFVLEASPFPKLPIEALPPFIAGDDKFHVSAVPQSKEDSAINGTDAMIPFDRYQKPNPLIILLDGVQDPGNLGGIIRTAYYLGVSAVAYVPRTTSSISPVVVKSSAGAAEFLPLLRVSNSSLDFISGSRRAGWKVYAAVAPDSVKEQMANTRRKGQGRQPTMDLSGLWPLLDKSPCVLVLGGEGFGIPPKVLEQVDGKVIIRGVKRPKLDGLDSLNVSVAAGLLSSAFLGPGESQVNWIGKGHMDQEDGGDENIRPETGKQIDRVLKEDMYEDEEGNENTKRAENEEEKGKGDWGRIF